MLDDPRMEILDESVKFFQMRDINEKLADNLLLAFDFMEARDEAAKQDTGNTNAKAGTANTKAIPRAQANRGASGVTPTIHRIGRSQ